ncbi:Outer membrane protein TolC [Chitinophaga sp. CF118]|uniref:TolC family protein n=1 Tax=Chitinophaga sp. CF118 TaxID=1884367 RepID=UPI0008E2AA9D|nr:TolC family protein [Chitinophaga sp. CF118]SFE59669.1 Outer membrane protein TolC [Chitinophaga sp. CF118]
MKTFSVILKLGIFPLFFWVSVFSLKAQTVDSTTIRLSLNEAVRYAKESNKLIGVLKTEESATQLDLDDAKMGALPRILSNASYQRYSKITLYEGVLGDSRQITKPPNANAGALGLEASFNLYSGGRQQSVITDLKRKGELASINTKEQEVNIGLQVALQYLDMIRFYFQERLIKDQVVRARTRSENINAFYANGKVTKSDVLRADVLLSNILLSETANKNDYLISNQKLNTLLNLDEFTKIIPVDTTSLNLADSLEFERLLEDYSGSYAILKARKNIELQENRTKLAKSFNRPSVTLFGGYGFNYPNTLIFPPVAQTFAVGMAGVRLTYDISSLYQNKNKIKSARLRETELKQQKDWIEDNVQQEAKALAIKYNEAVNRILVIKKSIEQAEINYNIQNTKYSNQLSLLTDLLEADNLYQESRFNYVQANIAALSIYYRLLFITGKL